MCGSRGLLVGPLRQRLAVDLGVPCGGRRGRRSETTRPGAIWPDARPQRPRALLATYLDHRPRLADLRCSSGIEHAGQPRASSPVPKLVGTRAMLALNSHADPAACVCVLACALHPVSLCDANAYLTKLVVSPGARFSYPWGEQYQRTQTLKKSKLGGS